MSKNYCLGEKTLKRKMVLEFPVFWEKSRKIPIFSQNDSAKNQTRVAVHYEAFFRPFSMSSQQNMSFDQKNLPQKKEMTRK